MITKKNISCLPSLPEWVEKMLVNFGGLIGLDTTHLENIGPHNKVDCLVVYEKEYFEHREILKNALMKKHLETLVIFNTHVMEPDEHTLEEIDNLSKDLDIHMICQGYFAKRYNHIKIHHIEIEEHVISHHFNLLLATKLQEMRTPEKMFLLQIVNKDRFRETVLDGVTSSPDLTNDIIAIDRKGQGASGKLRKKVQDWLLNHIKEEYKDNPNLFSALESFGNGPPNFPLYEKTFCEVVAETRNIGAWHFTEKTFRPIAFRVPIVYLGSKEMYDTLHGYGYKLYDYDFYQHWHDQTTPLNQRVERLVFFMKHIKQDEKAREQMQATAENNFQIFWNQRKLYYYQNWNKIFDQICGKKNIGRVVDSVYSRCNF